MDLKNLFVASVFNNFDPMMQGRVQVYVPSFMASFIPIFYPWARPFHLGSGASSTAGMQNVPEIGSKVFIFFEDPETKRHPYYLADAQLGLIAPTFLMEVAKGLVGSNAVVYPDLKFQVLKNGACFAMNSTPGPAAEIFFCIPSSGTYMIINGLGQIDINSPTAHVFLDSDGSIELSGLSDIDLLTTLGDINLETDYGSISIATTFFGLSLLSVLSLILDHIMVHSHPTPLGPTGPPTNAFDFYLDQLDTETLLK